MLCKNIIQKVSNMVLFKDCKSSSATICKSSSAANMPPNINICIRKRKKEKKKKLRKNRGSSCSKNHKELIHMFILVFQVVRCSIYIYIYIYITNSYK